jgi:hypothetical protein
MVVLEITVRSGVVEWHQTVSGKYGLERRSGGSTSYGGTTRVRFEGSFPRVGKSRLCDR